MSIELFNRVSAGHLTPQEAAKLLEPDRPEPLRDERFWRGVAVGIILAGLAALVSGCAASCEQKQDEPVDFCKLEKTVILTAEERRILCGPIELKGMP